MVGQIGQPAPCQGQHLTPILLVECSTLAKGCDVIANSL